MDFILNGKASGSVAATLMQHDFDVNVLRPYIGEDGRSYITVNQGGRPTAVPLLNTAATLRKDEWKQLDDVVIKAAKQRLRIVSDLRAAGLQYVIPNGMGKTVLLSETQTDINDATISMDGLAKGANDRPEYDLVNLPLPIIHKDFHFSARQLATSRNGASPLDTTMAELAGRKVAEEIEKLTCGVEDTYTYGGGTIYGLHNYTNRLTKTMTSPTTSTWTGGKLVEEVLAMRKQSRDAYHYGPWMIYNSPNWDQYLDQDYSTSKGDNTVRERLRKIDGIQDVRTLDYLEDFSMELVQMTSDVIRMVIGMEITTLQWESEGGMQLNFKVMAIQVPQLRADSNSNTGIVDGQG